MREPLSPLPENALIGKSWGTMKWSTAAFMVDMLLSQRAEAWGTQGKFCLTRQFLYTCTLFSFVYPLLAYMSISCSGALDTVLCEKLFHCTGPSSKAVLLIFLWGPMRRVKHFNENVGIHIVWNHFSSDAWMVVVKCKLETMVWRSCACFHDLHTEQSIVCDSGFIFNVSPGVVTAP